MPSNAFGCVPCHINRVNVGFSELAVDTRGWVNNITGVWSYRKVGPPFFDILRKVQS
jgi:hypothetical protein